MQPASVLTQTQIDELTQALLRLRDGLDAALATSTEAAKPVDLDEPIGRLSRMDAIQQQQMARAALAASRLRRLQITAALAAIDNGDYGQCRKCEEPIGYARLVAAPEAPLCIECQTLTEQR